MSYRMREIETKWLVLDQNLESVNAVLHDVLGPTVRDKTYGRSTDTYWTVPGDTAADFLRIRELTDDVTQITVKGRDRGTNENRLEIDIDTETGHNRVFRAMQAVLGKPSGSITKQYYVYWPTENQYLTICCYVVERPGETQLVIADNQERSVEPVFYPHVVVEVETTSREDLDFWNLLITRGLRERGLLVEKAPGSLFEMFIKKESR